MTTSTDLYVLRAECARLARPKRIFFPEVFG